MVAGCLQGRWVDETENAVAQAGAGMICGNALCVHACMCVHDYMAAPARSIAMLCSVCNAGTRMSVGFCCCLGRQRCHVFCRPGMIGRNSYVLPCCSTVMLQSITGGTSNFLSLQTPSRSPLVDPCPDQAWHTFDVCYKDKGSEAGSAAKYQQVAQVLRCELDITSAALGTAHARTCCDQRGGAAG